MLSYSSMYVEAERLVIKHLSDAALKTLRYLATRADEYGICWPGIRTIAEETGKCKDAVQASVDELERTGCITYIRRNARDPISGHTLANVYQVSPYLYAIRPQYQAQAEACWHEHGGKSLSFPVPSNLHNHNITNASKPKSDTSYIDQQQQARLESEGSLSFDYPSTELRAGAQDKSFTPPPALPDREEKTDEYVNSQPAAPSTHRPQRSEAGQQRSKKPSVPRGNRSTNTSDSHRERPASATSFAKAAKAKQATAGKPAYPTIERIAEELPNQVEEWLADRCRHDTSMSIRFARGLIKHYSGTRVEAALNDPALRGSTSIKNKAGYVFWLLVNGFIEPASEIYGRPDDPDGSRYISGEYADFVEH